MNIDLVNVQWLWLVALAGVIEAVFLVDQPGRYLINRQCGFIGTLADNVSFSFLLNVRLSLWKI